MFSVCSQNFITVVNHEFEQELAYLVCAVRLSFNVSFSIRRVWIPQVANRCYGTITCSDAKNVVSFTHSHCTVACDCSTPAAFVASVHLKMYTTRPSMTE